MIDVHVLTHEGTSPQWLEQALASLEGQDATVHVVNNHGLSVGAGRARGYQLGAHPYVSYLDSDDYLLPGTIEACIAALAHHRCVVTQELVEYPDGNRYPFPRQGHAMTVYRREDVRPWLERLAKSPHCADGWLRQILQPHQLAHVGYVWRVHPAGDHYQVTPETIQQEAAVWRTQTEQR